MGYKQGDTVQYEDKQWTIVDWDEINEQWVCEDSAGERIGIPEDLLGEWGEPQYYRDRTPSKDSAADEKGPGGFFRDIKKAEAKAKGKRTADTEPKPAPKKPEFNPAKFVDALETGETAKEAEAKKNKADAKKAAAAARAAAKKAKDEAETAADNQHQEKIKPAMKALASRRVQTSSYEETEGNTIMDDLQVGDIVVYEDKECLVVELDINEQTAVIEDEDGDQITASIDEMTKAAETIKGKAAYNTSMMTADVIKAFGSMSSSDQTEFFNKMMAQYGKGKDWGVGNKAGSNKSSIAGKRSAASGETVSDLSKFQKQMTKEDLEEILAGEDLSEDFREKASTLFEAAVNLRVATIEAELQEKFEQDLEERFAELTEQVEDQIDRYLSYVAEEWVAENEVAIENNLKSELSESLIAGLHNLLSEHYIDIPEQQVDVVEALTAKVQQLEADLNEQISSNIDLCEAIEQYSQEEVFAEVSEGLAVTQVEKFRTLTEGVEFSGDHDEYRAKLGIIREKYFQQNTAPSSLNEEVEIEEEGISEMVTNAFVDPNVARMAAAISRTVKR